MEFAGSGMRAHILAIAVIAGVIILSLAAGRAMTEHLLAAKAPALEQSAADAATTAPQK